MLHAFCLVQVCRSFQNRPAGSLCFAEPKILNPELLQRVLEILDVSDFNHFELEDMFEDGLRCMKECSSLVENGLECNLAASEKLKDGKMDNATTATSQELPLKYLIAGSETFRTSLLALKADAVFCSMIESVLLNFVTPNQLQMLAEGGKEIQEHRIGEVIYSSRKSKEGVWYILSSGRLKISLDDLQENKEEAMDFELTAGEIFGGFCIAPCKETVSHIMVRTIQPCNIIQLQAFHLKTLLKEDPESAGKLLLMMGGNNSVFTVFAPSIWIDRFDF